MSKACPFCGCNRTRFRCWGEDVWTVECLVCEAEGPTSISLKESKKKWETRHADE